MKNFIKMMTEEILKEEVEVVESKNGKTVMILPHVQDHINSTHNAIGKGSVFVPGIQLKDLTSKISLLNIDDSALFNITYNNAGWDLIKSKSEVEDLKNKYVNAKETTVEKSEGRGTVTVPALQLPIKLNDIRKTNVITVVIRKSSSEYIDDSSLKKQAEEKNNVYALLTAWPGRSHIDGIEIPPASKWNNKYYVIIPQE